MTSVAYICYISSANQTFDKVALGAPLLSLSLVFSHVQVTVKHIRFNSEWSQINFTLTLFWLINKWKCFIFLCLTLLFCSPLQILYKEANKNFMPTGFSLPHDTPLIKQVKLNSLNTSDVSGSLFMLTFLHLVLFLWNDFTHLCFRLRRLNTRKPMRWPRLRPTLFTRRESTLSEPGKLTRSSTTWANLLPMPRTQTARWSVSDMWSASLSAASVSWAVPQEQGQDPHNLRNPRYQTSQEQPDAPQRRMEPFSTRRLLLHTSVRAPVLSFVFMSYWYISCLLPAVVQGEVQQQQRSADLPAHHTSADPLLSRQRDHQWGMGFCQRPRNHTKIARCFFFYLIFKNFFFKLKYKEDLQWLRGVGCFLYNTPEMVRLRNITQFNVRT